MWLAFLFWTVWTVLCATVGTYIAVKIALYEHLEQQQQQWMQQAQLLYPNSIGFPFTSSDQFRGGPVIHD